MDANKWQRARTLFELALDIPPERREQFLQEQCPDDADMVSDVLQLLRADAEADDAPSLMGAHAPDLLGEMAAEDDQRQADAWIGRQLGPWRIRRPIGHGGMGVVYLAERNDGEFHQQAAIKMLRGLPGAPAVARFVAERQILAALDHPHIARVLDGGTTELSGPWFALEFVDGVSITTWCDAQRLGISQRLRLFLDVCDAASYAHERLVVHRDIKPANILVDDQGRPTLLDFGIAKLLETDTAQTGTALRAFTPEYAAPEQIRGETITTAVDVYALGVVLYELLAGCRPYRVRETSTAAYERAVLEQDVVRPSVAIAEKSPPRADEASAARNRSLVPQTHRARLRGDLDAIVLKALRKEPSRRYGSVRELAEDLRAVLNHRPVQARRGGWRYVAGRFLRRNALASGMVTLTLLALIAGLVASLWQAREARIQRDAAEQSLAFMTELFENGDPGTSRSGDLTVRHLLDEGVRSIRFTLIDADRPRATLLLAMASAYLGLEQVKPAVPLVDEAMAIAEANKDIVTMANAAVQRCRLLGYIPDYDGCKRLAERAEGTLDPNDPAQAILIAQLIAQRMLGLRDKDRHEALIKAAQSALVLLQQASDHRSLRLRSELTGMMVRSLGQLARNGEAETIMRNFIDELRALDPAPPRLLADSLDNLSSILVDMGRGDEALELNRESLSGYERLYGVDNPINATKMNNLAVSFYSAGHLDEAIALMRRVVTISEKRSDDGKASSANLGNLGAFLVEAGQTREALAYLDSSISSYEAADARPANLAGFLWWRAVALIILDQTAEAEASLAKSRDILMSLHETSHPRFLRVRTLGLSLAVIDGGREAMGELWRDEAAAIVGDYAHLSEARPADVAFADFLLALGRAPTTAASTRSALSRLNRALKPDDFRHDLAERIRTASFR